MAVSPECSAELTTSTTFFSRSGCLSSSSETAAASAAEVSSVGTRGAAVEGAVLEVVEVAGLGERGEGSAIAFTISSTIGVRSSSEIRLPSM